MWVFTEHAEFVAAERNTSREWVEYVVSVFFHRPMEGKR
jgi:hypothetical protein